MYDIVQVANAILSKQTMTHKKLQKICYYFYSWYWIKHNKSLFDEKFEAWVHGPVSPILYKKFKSHGWKEIEVNKSSNCLSKEDNDFLDKLLSIYGKYSADDLEELTHSELPWKIARIGLGRNESSDNKIKIEDILNYYIEQDEIKEKLIG